jgi:hypothetical protein
LFHTNSTVLNTLDDLNCIENQRCSFILELNDENNSPLSLSPFEVIIQPTQTFDISNIQVKISENKTQSTISFYPHTTDVYVVSFPTHPELDPIEISILPGITFNFDESYAQLENYWSLTAGEKLMLQFVLRDDSSHPFPNTTNQVFNATIQSLNSPLSLTMNVSANDTSVLEGTVT